MTNNTGTMSNPVLGTAVGAVLAIGLVSFTAPAGAQQTYDPQTSPAQSPPTEPRTSATQTSPTQTSQSPSSQTQAGATAAAETADEALKDAQEQVKEAGEQITEAREASREAVRAGREASRAAQAAERQELQRRAAQQGGQPAPGAEQQREQQRDQQRDASSERSRTAVAGGPQGTSAQGSAQGSASAPDAVWLWVPVAVSTQSERQAKDCWVRLYSGENFEGRYVTITGPSEISELHSPYGTGLNNWESALVGPNATVTTYDGTNFRDRSATLRGGERYADLGDSKLGLFEDIESIRVTCGSEPATGAPGR